MFHPSVSSSFAEDLMSLLDADIHSAHPSVIIDADAMFSEDISYFGYPSFRRSSLSRLGSSRGTSPLIYDGLAGCRPGSGENTGVGLFLGDGALFYFFFFSDTWVIYFFFIAILQIVSLGVATNNLTSVNSNHFFFRFWRCFVFFVFFLDQ